MLLIALCKKLYPTKLPYPIAGNNFFGRVFMLDMLCRKAATSMEGRITGGIWLF